MAPEKRNIYLDTGDSEDESDRGYDSGADELRKGVAKSRSNKRRKLEDDVSDNSDSDLEDNESTSGNEEEKPKHSATKEKNEEEKPKHAATKEKRKRAGEPENGNGDKEEDDDDHDDGDDDEKDIDKKDVKKREKGSKKEKKKDGKDKAKDPLAHRKATDLPGLSQPLTKKNLVVSEKEVRRSGVVYLSHVPPFMKPTKLRSLLEPYGKINRIFLSPEDHAVHSRRVRGGGNKKRSFVDGWVEFVRKSDAKRACDLLNAQTIGGKKGTFYRDDLWNLLYLRGFKWHHLTEQIAAENAERDLRLRSEMAHTKAENEDFVRNIERSKMLETMAAKKSGREADEGGDNRNGADKGEQNGGSGSKETEAGRKRTQTFKQTPLVARPNKDEQVERVQALKSKIF